MTDNSTRDQALPVFRKFVLYRTEPLGWQPAGWVILQMELARAEDGIRVPGTAWAEVPDDASYVSGDSFTPPPQGDEKNSSPETPAR